MPGHAPIGGAPLGAVLGAALPTGAEVVVSEGIRLTQTGAPVARRAVLGVEGIRLAQAEVPVASRSALSADTLQIDDALAPLYGIIIAERLRLNARLARTGIEQVALGDAVRLVEKLYQGWQMVLADGVGLALLQDLHRAVALVEELGLAGAVAGNATYHLTLTQALRLTDSLARFFGADMTDGFAISGTMFARVRAFATAADTVGVEAVLAPQLLLHVGVVDGVELHAEQLVRMLFNPQLREGVLFEAGYLAPNGSFTTWVMNTRTGAVTEYADFVFNSFAPVGNRYLGASDTGLYELLGDDDAGADIIARIKSGYLQFGGTQLSRLKEAYIAARGEGDFVLRIRTADGDVYNYGVSSRNMRSTKVHMGKGQRSRYFAFELISAGQDFDLDTLEFVPIVVQRRV